VSRYDASTVNDLTELVSLVAQCVIDQDNGLDVLSSASWDRVRSWIRGKALTVNLALEDHDHNYRMCYECGHFFSEPELRRTGVCFGCREDEK